MKRTERTLQTAAWCLLALLTAGCAALSTLETKQATLEERVKGYLQAQVDRKWDVAYTFFDSSSREKISRESYLQLPRTVSFTGFTIDQITVLPAGDQATVKVGIDLFVMGYNFPRAPQTQTWVKEAGGWFVRQPERSPRGNPFAPAGKKK